MLPNRLEVSATTKPAGETAADTIAVGLFEDESIAHDVDGATLQGLVDAGEARARFKHLALAHAHSLGQVGPPRTERRRRLSSPCCKKAGPKI